MASWGVSAGLASAAGERFQPAPLYGADLRSLAFDPASPDRAFAGSSAGHVYRSEDGGSTWRNAGAELPFAGWVVGTLRFDPDRPSRLWAGLWGIWGGGLVARSDDLGVSWELLPLGAFAADQVYALARVPGAPERLFAGTRAGMIRSDDGGGTWRAVGREVAGLIHVSSLHVDAARTGTILAGTWRRAYRSDDGGSSWSGVFDGMVLDTEVFSLHPIPGEAGGLWASSCGWVYRGQRWGDRWQRHQSGLAEKRTPSFAVLAPERLLAGTVAGSFLSTDGGATFRRTSPANLVVLAIAHHPARPERVLLATEGSGAWLSTDGGESFANRAVGMRNVRVAALASLGDQVFAALAHAGPSSGVFRSPDGGASFEPSPASLPTVLDLAGIDRRLFAATERGLFERVDGAWQKQPTIGDARVEQVFGSGTRAIARATQALLVAELAARGARWQTVPFSFRRPLAVAAVSGALWVLREDGLFRLAFGKWQDRPVPVSLPYRGGRLVGARDEIVYFGDEGTFRRAGMAGAWTPVVPGRSSALATGDRRFSFVAVTQGDAIAGGPSSAGLFDAEQQRLHLLETPFPAREILSVLVVGDRLLLGTSGFGLWETRLPE